MAEPARNDAHFEPSGDNMMYDEEEDIYNASEPDIHRNQPPDDEEDEEVEELSRYHHDEQLASIQRVRFALEGSFDFRSAFAPPLARSEPVSGIAQSTIRTRQPARGVTNNIQELLSLLRNAEARSADDVQPANTRRALIPYAAPTRATHRRLHILASLERFITHEGQTGNVHTGVDPNHHHIGRPRRLSYLETIASRSLPLRVKFQVLPNQHRLEHTLIGVHLQGDIENAALPAGPCYVCRTSEVGGVDCSFVGGAPCVPCRGEGYGVRYCLTGQGAMEM